MRRHVMLRQRPEPPELPVVQSEVELDGSRSTRAAPGERQPHRAKEFISFLKCVGRAVKKALDVHLVPDSYGTHKIPRSRRGSASTRFRCHFTPTSASGLNLVERFFAEITTKRIRRGHSRASQSSRMPVATT